MPIVTLTTDFGLHGAYVAAMKGVILGINPDARIVDVSHSIEPQNIRQAAFLLSTVHAYYPPGTVHVVVVDPEVGSHRRAIILKTPEAFFVAPDNGVLSYVVHRAASPGTIPQTGPACLPPGLRAVEITNPVYWRHPVSSTFHGRDIFAPVAAHLSLGVPFSEFGDDVTSMTLFPMPGPVAGPEGLTGHALHVDPFGNIITDIRSEDLPATGLQVDIAGRQIEGLRNTYADVEPGLLLALIGSSGYLEISLRNGNAAQALGIKPGDELKVRRV